MNERIKFVLFCIIWVVICFVLNILNLIYGSGSTPIGR